MATNNHYDGTGSAGERAAVLVIPVMTTEVLVDFITRVQQSRERTNPRFPLPTVEKCIRYAITEAAEFDDARLRLEAPDHIRNNHRNDDPRREWGQCGYMLASAWIQRGYGSSARCQAIVYAGKGRYCDAVYEIAYALKWVTDGSDHQPSLEYAIDAWCAVCDANGWDPDELIDETCKTFESKHAVKEAS